MSKSEEFYNLMNSFISSNYPQGLLQNETEDLAKSCSAILANLIFVMHSTLSEKSGREESIDECVFDTYRLIKKMIREMENTLEQTH